MSNRNKIKRTIQKEIKTSWALLKRYYILMTGITLFIYNFLNVEIEKYKPGFDFPSDGGQYSYRLVFEDVIANPFLMIFSILLVVLGFLKLKENKNN